MKILKDLIYADTHNYKGIVHHQFADLAHLFSRLQDSRTEQGGASLAVYYGQEKVVDIYVGKKSSSEEWSEDTMAMCYSTGKGILATLSHILVSEGKLDYRQPIADYWPEFAEHGKSKITLADVLSHRSGLYDVRNVIAQASEMADWDHMLNVMASATPRFKPNSNYAYQALTYGWLLGGLIEKATQQNLSELMNQYLVEPLQLDGAYFGVPQDQLSRIAKPLEKTNIEKKSSTTQVAQQKKKKQKVSFSDRIIQYSGQNPDDFIDAMIPKGMKGFSFFDDRVLTQPIPAANGVFTARSLAKIYAMMAHYGQFESRQFIKPLVFKQLSQIQSYDRDKVMPIPMHWRLGYHRVITLGKSAKNGFGHMGYNGSGAWCDPERKLSFAYTHNYPVGSITGDYRLWSLSQEALRCVDHINNGKKGWF